MISNKCEIYIYGEESSLKKFESVINNEHEYGIEIIGDFEIDDFETNENSIALDADVNGNLLSTFFFEKQDTLNKIMLENPIEKLENSISLESYDKLMDAINSSRKEISQENFNHENFERVFFDKKIDLISASYLFELRIELENKDYYDSVSRKIILEKGLVIENSFESISSNEDNSDEEEDEIFGLQIQYME